MIHNAPMVAPFDETHDDEYDRRIYVRFDAESKELVRKAAAGARLSPYIAHFASEAAKVGKRLVATPPAGSREAGVGVFARFASPAIKQMVAAMAGKCGVKRFRPTSPCLGEFESPGGNGQYCDNCKPMARRARDAMRVTVSLRQIGAAFEFAGACHCASRAPRATRAARLWGRHFAAALGRFHGEVGGIEAQAVRSPGIPGPSVCIDCSADLPVPRNNSRKRCFACSYKRDVATRAAWLAAHPAPRRGRLAVTTTCKFKGGADLPEIYRESYRPTSPCLGQFQRKNRNRGEKYCDNCKPMARMWKRRQYTQLYARDRGKILIEEVRNSEAIKLEMIAIYLRRHPKESSYKDVREIFGNELSNSIIVRARELVKLGMIAPDLEEINGAS